MADKHLIIFVKNPVPGTVKTRIARRVGNEQAVQIYRHLLQHTQQITQVLPYHRVVYYGDIVNDNDGWNGYDKRLQGGADLGQRMRNAFQEQFAGEGDGTTPGQVVIIGSDCLAITAYHIHQAFKALDTADVVIGPATDGGYYLLGMRQFYPFLFEDMPWSQPELRRLTELAMLQNGLTFERLEELTDIDEWEDYQKAIQ
ncbi:glycosyltransferase [Spirosoma taeanense]|uniref:Glycosyltransferase n=1 Tax=Spirosoma taeanense TaxID=2735870 RepID=A0A6M5Y398_9BACT|nr:TIGR04282 family arsenosugar biosynthesis glycosyltransferase [Spirosoma taeanense]QJW88205.1 glycosyltransferase [Spirosoma taeanense]